MHLVLEEASGTPIPDHDPVGIQRILSSHAPGNIGSVEISVDISHTWVADLRGNLRSPAGTNVILHRETGGDSDDIIKTYTATTTPALGGLTGELISGDWQLSISDHAGEDVGKLNNWRIVINPLS